jgi:AraC-like DNA-binding protein
MYAIYQQGATLKEVGQRYGISDRRVGELFKRAGLKTRPGSPEVDDARVQEMYELYQQGATLKGAGEPFGRSEGYVSACFKRAGLPTREKVGSGSQTRPRRSLADGYPVNAMYATYQDGASLSQVAERFGVSKPVVSKLFKEAGLKTRPAPTAVDPAVVQEMYAQYKRGATLQEVGAEFGITRERVRQLFGKADLKTRSIADAGKLRHGTGAPY